MNYKKKHEAVDIAQLMNPQSIAYVFLRFLTLYIIFFILTER